MDTLQLLTRTVSEGYWLYRSISSRPWLYEPMIVENPGITGTLIMGLNNRFVNQHIYSKVNCIEAKEQLWPIMANMPKYTEAVANFSPRIIFIFFLKKKWDGSIRLGG